MFILFLREYPWKYIALIWVSKSCYNKLPQTWWLKTTQIYCLTVLEARNFKSRCWPGLAPFEVSGRETFLASSSIWWLQTFLGWWLHISSLWLCLHISFSFVPLSSLLSLIKTLAIGFRVNQIIQDDLKILNLITSLKTIFLIRSQSQVLGFRMWTYLLGGHLLYLTSPNMHTHSPLPLLMKRFFIHLDSEILGKI